MTTSPNPAQRLGEFIYDDGSEHGGAEILRVIAVGSLSVVDQYVMKMYQLDYAEPHEWSRLLPAPNPNEVMRILTKRIVN